MSLLVARPAPVNKLFVNVQNLLVQAYYGLFYE